MAEKTKIKFERSLEREHSLKHLISERILPDRFINFGRLTKLSKCIGFIGPRGSMKSLSTAAMSIIDYLVPGYNVFSNMDIAWGLNLGDYSVGYASKPLDRADLYAFDVSNGLLVIDEPNMEFSEARRSMTNQNLTFNRIIQQLRKKQLNMIYAVQHEMWVDDRLRYQTDVFISCKDILLKPGNINLPYDFGTYCEWTIYDMSGFLGKGTFDETGEPHSLVKFYGKRWWNTYDTNQIQAEEDIKYGSFNQPRSKEIPMSVEEVALRDTVQSTLIDIVNSNAETIGESELLSILDKKVEFIVTPESLSDTLKSNSWISGVKYSSGKKYYLLRKTVINKRERMLVSV